MENSEHWQSAAYGAYRLKSTYQRNMLWALGVTTGLVILTVALAAVLLGSSAVPASPGGGSDDGQSDTVVVRLRPAPIVIPPGPEIKPDPPKQNRDVGATLVPIDDSSWTEELNPYPSGSSGMHCGDSAVEGGSGGGDDVWSGTAFDTVEYLPPMDSFVPVERTPELIFSIQPEYPRWVKDAGIEGMVVIKALVGRRGDVLDAVVYVSSGNKLLDEAALAVAGKYKYQPAVQNGRPVAVWVTYKVDFTLAQ